MVEFNIEMPDTRKNHARRLKMAGYTYKQIGEMLGVSTGTAQGYLRIPRSLDMPKSCRKCGKESKSLHAHHLSYEDDKHYEMLCNKCHRLEHHNEPIKEPLPLWRPVIVDDGGQRRSGENENDEPRVGRPRKCAKDKLKVFSLRFSDSEINVLKLAAGTIPLRRWIAETLLNHASCTQTRSEGQN